MTEEQIAALVAQIRRTYTDDLIDALEAENARLRERLAQAIERLRDMLQGDDGQAWGEAQQFVDIIAQETQP